MTLRVLVGDVGGTNARFGVAEISAGKITILQFHKFANDAFDDFSSALSAYVSQSGLDTSALASVFALAGPPIDGTVKLTNRNWTISARDLQQKFGFESVELINDFIAMARAVPELDPEHFVEIRPGTPRDAAPMIVTGPGTGLGVATLLPQPSGRWQVIGGEGGHMAYAPQTDIERKLAARMQAAMGYVANERVCAGIGLEDVHQTLCKIFDRPHVPMAPGDMLDHAAKGDEMFLELCGIRARGTMRVAGDLALANGALGGVILAGGVSERLVDYLKRKDAVDAFAERGLSTYLAPCPVHLMTDPAAPLIGAAAWCLRE